MPTPQRRADGGTLVVCDSIGASKWTWGNETGPQPRGSSGPVGRRGSLCSEVGASSCNQLFDRRGGVNLQTEGAPLQTERPPPRLPECGFSQRTVGSEMEHTSRRGPQNGFTCPWSLCRRPQQLSRACGT